MRTQDLTQREKTLSDAIPVELELSETELIKAFQRLSPERREELLDKLQALREPAVQTMPARRLHDLTGLVSLGGDALADTEALYNGDGGH